MCTTTNCIARCGTNNRANVYRFDVAEEYDMSATPAITTISEQTSPVDATPVKPPAADHTKLKISFHGRIIDHLGIQMYQSPVAAIAELISNAWDADAEVVSVTLPHQVGPDAIIKVCDSGSGMTFEQCESRFLAVGRNRRPKADEVTLDKQRPVLGRKGIGKFAGFGIARVIEVDTISKETGEKTVFELDLEQLRAGEYIEKNGVINVTEYLGPDEARKEQHSTTITLKALTLGKTPNVEQFAMSMARRFGLRGQMQDFVVTIDGTKLPEPEDVAEVEMVFPRDYTPEKLLEHGIELEGEWGTEHLADGYPIRWRIAFYKKPIGDEDLRGVAIFAHVKLAQRPFDFNVIGASGQHGLQYMAGRVQADYIDMLPDDLIAPERQRINWTVEQTGPFLAWGQGRVKELLGLWRDRRSSEKIDLLEQRIAPFAARLAKLQKHERKTVESALRSLASIPSLDQDQFVSLSQSVLTAWEGGRLRDLIHDIGEAQVMEVNDLMSILIEANVLTSLHTAEAVKAKIDLIAGLNERIKNQQLENAIRDYVATNPWLIDHKWETFQVEHSIANVCKAAAEEAALDKEEDWDKRIDLVLSSGSQLLVLEFMRPGLMVDRDHMDRFELYVDAITAQLNATTASPFKEVRGLLVCDKLHKSPTTQVKLANMAKRDLLAMDWQTLLARASDRWREFMEVLIERAPEDDRLRDLASSLGIPLPALHTLTALPPEAAVAAVPAESPQPEASA